MEPCTFRPKLKKIKKSTPTNFLHSNIKKRLKFSQNKSALIFQEMKTLKKFFISSQKKVFLIFRKMETPKIFLYISGSGNLRKLLIFQGVTF